MSADVTTVTGLNGIQLTNEGDAHPVTHGYSGRAFYAVEKAPWDTASSDKVSHAVNSEQALELGGLDWDVAKHDVYVNFNGNDILVDNFTAIVRQDNGAVLGMSRGRYEILQNREMFEWTDSLVADGIAKYVGAGSFFGGKKVWLQMEMKEGMTIAGEEYRKYVTAITGHDMDTAFRAFTNSMRIYCLNTFYMVLNSQSNGIRVHHHPKMHKSLDYARKQMQVIDEKQTRLAEWLEKASKHEINARSYSRMEEKLFGTYDEATPAQRRKAIETFRSIYASEKELVGETAYAFFNAVTGFADHAKTYQGKDDDELKAERRFQSIMSGTSAHLKAEAVEVVGALKGMDALKV